MLFAATGAHDTTVQVTIITTIGLIVVAVIGVWQVKVTQGAKKEAKTNAVEASNSAEIAKDYAAAAGAKDALIASLEGRIKWLEDENRRLDQKLTEFERKMEENHEQQRAAALLERDYAREIDELRAELAALRAG